MNKGELVPAQIDDVFKIKEVEDLRSLMLCQKSCFGLIFHLNHLPEVFLEDNVPVFISLRGRSLLKYNPLVRDLRSFTLILFIRGLSHRLLVRVLWARLLGTHSLFFFCLRISIYISAESESYK